MLTITLKTTWTQLLSKYTADESIITAGFDTIVTRYTEAHRYYHTLEHLESLLQLQEKYAAAITDPDTLQFAIFFHDLIYNVKQSDNEEKSATAAADFLQQLPYPATRTTSVTAYIRATKNHQHTNGDTDLDHFLDFDLAILGASAGAYQTYTQQIRKEYAIYPNLLYKPGRRKVLQHFLALPAIYKTAAFREQYEEAARKNLAAELETLG